MARRPNFETGAAYVVAFGTVVLAAFTAWLAYDTHKVAQVTYEESSLERKVAVARLCDTASRDEARSGDGVMDFQPHSPDGFEYSDRISKDELLPYLRSQANDFVRCEIVNVGRLPLLEVQLAMTGVTKRRTIRMETSPFLSVAPGGSQAFWFVNNSDETVKLLSPNRIRYQVFDTGESVLRDALPKLNDAWVVRPNRAVIEYLDQRQMAPF